MGSASLLSRSGRGIWPRDVLKEVSRGLSRVEAGNPGFPRLVQVTSGGFSWWLCEARETGGGRGLSGLHWVWCIGRGPHLQLRQEQQGQRTGLWHLGYGFDVHDHVVVILVRATVQRGVFPCKDIARRSPDARCMPRQLDPIAVATVVHQLLIPAIPAGLRKERGATSVDVIAERGRRELRPRIQGAKYVELVQVVRLYAHPGALGGAARD